MAMDAMVALAILAQIGCKQVEQGQKGQLIFHIFSQTNTNHKHRANLI